MSKTVLKVGRERAVGGGRSLEDRRFVDSTPAATIARHLVNANEHRLTRTQMAARARLSQPIVSRAIAGWRSEEEAMAVVIAIEKTLNY